MPKISITLLYALSEFVDQKTHELDTLTQSAYVSDCIAADSWIKQAADTNLPKWNHNAQHQADTIELL